MLDSFVDSVSGEFLRPRQLLVWHQRTVQLYKMASGDCPDWVAISRKSDSLGLPCQDNLHPYNPTVLSKGCSLAFGEF